MTPAQRRAAAALQALLTPEHTALCLAELESVRSDDPDLAARVAALRAGDLSAVLALEPEDGRDELSFSLYRLGGTAPHCAELGRTLAAGWHLAELDGGAEAELEESGTTVVTGRLVPVTGLWLAVGRADGCPNLLLEGTVAPEGVWATERVEWDDGVVAWETATHPTTWVLLRSSSA